MLNKSITHIFCLALLAIFSLAFSACDTCPFEPVELVTTEETTSISLDFSIEVAAKVDRIRKLPVDADGAAELASELNHLTKQYREKPIDKELASVYNVNREEICGLYRSLKSATTSTEKAMYEKAMQKALDRFFQDMVVYKEKKGGVRHSGGDPAPGDPSKIIDFMDDKVNNAAPSDKGYWEKRRKIVLGHVTTCQQSPNPQECLDGLLKETQSLYDEH